MLSDKQAATLKQHIKDELKDDWDKIDADSIIDHSLTYYENKRVLDEHIGQLQGDRQAEDYQANADRRQWLESKEWRQAKATDWGKILKHARTQTIFILGDHRTGKTALQYKILLEAQQSGIPCFWLQHPLPDLLEELNVQNLTGFGQVGFLRDCLVCIDEAEFALPNKNPDAKDMFTKLMSLSGQLGIKFLLSTSDSRWSTAQMESYFDCYIVKDLDYTMLKRGSKAKTVIDNYCQHSSMIAKEFKLENDQFLFYARHLPELNGLMTFEKPEGFSDLHSRPYR